MFYVMAKRHKDPTQPGPELILETDSYTAARDKRNEEMKQRNKGNSFPYIYIEGDAADIAALPASEQWYVIRREPAMLPGLAA